MSNEIIRTDGNGPDIAVEPNTNTTSINTDINVNMNISDKESGIQYYTYTITKDGQQLKSDTQAPQYRSNISVNSHFVAEDDQSLYNNQYKGGYVTDYDPETTAIPYSTKEMEQNIKLSGVGDYTVEITAVDNVANSNKATFHYTINPPPPKLNAEIVNENYESFNGIPTLKRGKLYNLKIHTEQYAEYLYITFPFPVLPDLQSLQKYGNDESYDSLSTKTIDITPKVSDTNYLPFIHLLYQ